MKKFVDLHLCAPFKDIDRTERMIKKSSELGYDVVGTPLPQNVAIEEIEELRKLCEDKYMDFVTRVDLAPKTPHELTSALRRLRSKFEVISVNCASKSVARQAAKDRRVDLISFSASEPHKRFFDRAEAELASKAFASLEIDMAPILSLEGFHRVRLLSSLRREVVIAKSFGVPLTISSGATNEYLLRKPQDFAALASLFDMAPSLALSALSEVPAGIVQQNREKLSPDYVAPGIRLVRRADSCLSK